MISHLNAGYAKFGCHSRTPAAINTTLLLAAADSQSDLRSVITGSEDDQDLLITSEGKSKATETRNIPYGSSYKHSGAASLLSVDYETYQHLSAEEISLHYSDVAASLTSPQVCYVYGDSNRKSVRL